jgi:hypothetical protein
MRPSNGQRIRGFTELLESKPTNRAELDCFVFKEVMDNSWLVSLQFRLQTIVLDKLLSFQPGPSVVGVRL